MTLRLTYIVIATLIGTLGNTSTARAATEPVAPPHPALSLQDAIKKGLGYSLEVKKSESQVKESHENVNKARGSLFPVINGRASATARQNATTLTSNSTATTSQGANGDTYLVGLDLTQPLYAGGALTAGLSYFKAGEDLSQQNYFSTKQDAVYNITTAYYTLAQAVENLQAAQQNREILKSYVDITRHYARIGRSRRMDELQAQVNFSLALADVEQSGNSVKNALSQLNRLLGVPNDQNYELNFKVGISPIGNLTLGDAYRAAHANNPAIRTAALAVEQVGYSEDLDLSQDMPSLTLTGSSGYQSPDTPRLFDGTSRYYSVGVNLIVPIFSGLTSVSKRHIYSERSYQAKRNLQIAEDTLRTNIEDALHTLRSTANTLELAQRSVKEARDALEIANKSYKQGIASSFDVVTMQNTRYNAEKLFITSQFSYLQALLTLRQQMGIDLEKAYAP